jgi:hypothetical protein
VDNRRHSELAVLPILGAFAVFGLGVSAFIFESAKAALGFAILFAAIVVPSRRRDAVFERFCRSGAWKWCLCIAAVLALSLVILAVMGVTLVFSSPGN